MHKKRYIFLKFIPKRRIGKTSIGRIIILTDKASSHNTGKIHNSFDVSSCLISFMQKSISPSDKIQVYLWHVGKDEVSLDDLKAEIATMN